MPNNVEETKAALKKLLESLQMNIENIAESNGISKDKLKDIREALIQGVPLYQILGIDKKVIDARYTVAYQLFTTGQYADAEKVFRWLCDNDSETPRHWMGLGAARQGQNNFEGAVDAYQMAAVYSCLTDPAPFYYSAVCFFKSNNMEAARVALQTALLIGKSEAEDQKDLLDKSKLLLENINKKINSQD